MRIFKTNSVKPPALPQVQEPEINPYESPRSCEHKIKRRGFVELIFYGEVAVLLGMVIFMSYKNRASDCLFDKIVERLISESNEDLKWKMTDLKNG